MSSCETWLPKKLLLITNKTPGRMKTIGSFYILFAQKNTMLLRMSKKSSNFAADL